MVFVGEAFETNESLQRLKSLLLDFFRGNVAESIDLTGLEHVICVSALTDSAVVDETHVKLTFRVYRPVLMKSGTRIPRVELTEMGPQFDFRLGRVTMASSEFYKKACKQAVDPSKIKKPGKNLSISNLGDKMGRIHMERQDLGKLQTRKMKGLKKSRDADIEDASDADRKKTKIEE